MARRRGQSKGELLNRSGMWGVRYYVDTPEIDPTTGKPRRERVIHWLAPSSGPNAIGRREVNRLRVDLMARIDQFAIRPSSMRTLNDFLRERFEPDVMAKLEVNTRLYYRSTLKHILPDLGALALRDITPGRVQQVINKAEAKGLTKTVRNIRSVLSAVLNHAKAMQWYAGDLPTEGVRVKESRPAERRAMTWDQVCALANALPEPTSTLVVFLTLTGLRIGEAAGLRWKMLNLTEETRIVNGEVIHPLSVAVRESFVRGRYKALKTRASLGNIPVPAWFMPRLWKLLTRGEWIAPDDPVFAAGNGSPFDQHNMAKRVLKPAAKALGMRWVSWHVFRHTNATLADQMGVSLTDRQRLLRHASDAMTRHYSHADIERLRGLIEGIGDPKLLQ